jgi:drug/metabolite transporter (DMT)-like permease
MQKNIFKGMLILTISPIIWGIMLVIGKSTLEVISPFYFVLIRYLPSAILLVLILFIKEGLHSIKLDKKFFLAVLLGLISFVGFNLFVWIGVGFSSAIVAAILMTLMPLITLLMSWIIFKKKPHISTLFIIGIAFIGVLMVITNGETSFIKQLNFWGSLLILFGVALSVVAAMGISHFKDWSMLKYTAITTTSGALFVGLLTIILTFFSQIKVPTVSELLYFKWELIYVGTITGTLAMLIWYSGIKIVGVTDSMLFSNLNPIVVVFISILIGIHITLFQLIGSIITVSVMLLHYLNVKRLNKSTKQKC